MSVILPPDRVKELRERQSGASAPSELTGSVLAGIALAVVLIIGACVALVMGGQR